MGARVRQALSADGPATRFLLLLFFLAFYYLSYRYPFKINSTTTSPTYSDTPALLQWGKYLIFLAISGYFLVRYYDPVRRITTSQALLAIGWTLAILQTVAVVLMYPNLFYLFEISIFSIILIVVIFCRFDQIDTRRIFKAILWFVIVAYAVNVIQLLLFTSTGRLPALAYANSIFVRFGSIWDDPNSFALFHAFIIPFIAFSPINRQLKGALLVLGACSLLLTQSISGVVGTLIGAGGAMSIYYAARPLKLFQAFFAIAAGVFLVVSIYGWNETFNLVHYWYELKEMSVERRGDFISDMFELELASYLGLMPTLKMSENGHMLVISHLGLIPFLLFIFTAGITISNMNRVRRYTSDAYAYALAMGAMGHTIGYMVANFGVPSLVVYPLNIVFMLSAALSILLYRMHRPVPLEGTALHSPVRTT